jgi:HK97 family phage major capsid protein
MTALVSATNELIEDNMTDQEVWSLVSELIGEKIAEFEDENVLVSSSKFTALLADTNVNVTNMATGEEFKDISYDDLIDIIRSVPMKYKKGQPRWFMNQDIVKHIEKIKDLDGEPIFHSSRSLRDGQIESYLL